MKKIICFLLAAVIALPFAACTKAGDPADKDPTDGFKGMYDEHYGRNDFLDWEIRDGVLYDFENDGADLMKKLTLTSYSGDLTFDTDANYVSSGKYSLKNVIKNDTSLAPASITYRFFTGNNGKDITRVSEITLDVYNLQDYELGIVPRLVFGNYGYEFDEIAIAASGKTRVSMGLSAEIKNYINMRPEYGLNSLTAITYVLTLPSGHDGDKTVYMDDLHYHADNSYEPEGGATPFARKDKNAADRELNDFDDFNRSLFVIPEYPYDDGARSYYAAASRYFKLEHSTSFKREGDGALKITNVGWEWEYDRNAIDVHGHTYKYPRLSFSGADMIGTTDLSNYKTLSVWVYYDRRSDTQGKESNPEYIQLFLQLYRSAVGSAYASSGRPMYIPANKWVNVRVDLTVDRFASRSRVEKIDIYTYGVAAFQDDIEFYIDDMRLSEQAVNRDDFNFTDGDYALYDENGAVIRT